jgi:hypothetical protein
MQYDEILTTVFKATPEDLCDPTLGGQKGHILVAAPDTAWHPKVMSALQKRQIVESIKSSSLSNRPLAKYKNLTCWIAVSAVVTALATIANVVIACYRK